MTSLSNPPEELIALHEDGNTPSGQWLIGAEHELLCIDGGGRAPRFNGDQGIEKVLTGIQSEVSDLSPVEESGRVIGLKGRGGSVPLEPGGLVELSGAAHPAVHALASETSC